MTCVYRFGPLESENATHEILSVLYPADLPRETIHPSGDYDDVAIQRLVNGAIDAAIASTCPRGEVGAATSASWWRFFFSWQAQARDALCVLRSDN